MSGRYLSLTMTCALSMACSGGGLPVGLADTPPGTGPMIVWDLEAEPLPEIPLPNDVATWPDPTSPTGRRLNASLIAPSGMERRLRQEFDRLDGFGTFGPLSVAFTEPLTRAEDTVIASAPPVEIDGPRSVRKERSAPRVVPRSFAATRRKWYVTPALRPPSRKDTCTGSLPDPAAAVSVRDP